MGGPEKLVAVIVGSSAVVGGLTVIGGEFAIKKVKRAIASRKERKSKLYKDAQVKYVIKQDGESNEGLKLCVGDSFRVLGSDGDAVLIALIGNKDNPYFVSKKLLEQISEYKGTGSAI